MPAASAYEVAGICLPTYQCYRLMDQRKPFLVVTTPTIAEAPTMTG